MANELSVSASISFKKNVSEVTRRLSGTVTISGDAAVQSVQNIGTSDESLALGDVATNGYLLVHNLDATNYITMGPDGTSYPIKLKAGEFGLVRWNGAAIHAKANTAACNLEYVLIED